MKLYGLLLCFWIFAVIMITLVAYLLVSTSVDISGSSTGYYWGIK